jgi:hypothetical protein
MSDDDADGRWYTSGEGKTLEREVRVVMPDV